MFTALHTYFSSLLSSASTAVPETVTSTVLAFLTTVPSSLSLILVRRCPSLRSLSLYLAPIFALTKRNRLRMLVERENGGGGRDSSGDDAGGTAGSIAMVTGPVGALRV